MNKDEINDELTRIKSLFDYKMNISPGRNLVNEQVDDELMNFANNYIENNSCDQIYQDMVKFREAVNNNQIKMSPEEKKNLLDSLNDNITKLKDQVIDAKILKETKCKYAKNLMKDFFKTQATENPERLKIMMCWFSENITKRKLNSCNSATVNTPQQSTDTSKQQNQPDKNQPIKTQTTKPTQDTFRRSIILPDLDL